jgi:hypothetical protein
LALEVQHRVITVAEASFMQLTFEGVQARREILVSVGVELDAEKRCRIPVDDPATERVERGVVTSVIEDELVHDLDGRWTVP